MPVISAETSRNQDSSSYAYLRSLIPFVFPPGGISVDRNTKCGRGVVVPITVAANTPITVTHNLGRFVQGMIPLINNAGATFVPKLKFGGGPSTVSEQSIEGDTDMTNCLVLLV